ncbi:MAG TPA: hypothetical protein DCR46_05000 [Cytophagales bacterium]|nr:hypothetical protein [Cytophagales bacterium]
MTSKVNLNEIQKYVHTDYGDLTGVIQIDGHSSISSIYDLCKEHKLDTSDLFIIGFSLWEDTINGIGKNDQVNCSILYVDKDEYGRDFDSVQKKIKVEETLRLKTKNIVIKYSSLGKHIKRFNLLVTSELTKHAKKIEIEDLKLKNKNETITTLSTALP